MRTIDADATLSFVDVGHLRNPNELCFSEMDVKNIIDKQPTISPAANWTPCSVALPEDGENKSEFEYDCTLSNGISEYRWVARLQRIYCGKDGYQWITSKGYQVKDETVIAWMPKPEPYRGEA